MSAVEMPAAPKSYSVGTRFKTRDRKNNHIYTIVDVYTTTNLADEVVKVEYVTAHDFMGQKIKGTVIKTTIDMGTLITD